MKLVMCLFFSLCLALSSCCGRCGNDAACVAKQNNNQSMRADWQITADVKKSIVSDGSLQASSKLVSVTTTNGVVMISGTVASKQDMHRIVRLANGVPGVMKVDNQMMVGS